MQGSEFGIYNVGTFYEHDERGVIRKSPEKAVFWYRGKDKIYSCVYATISRSRLTKKLECSEDFADHLKGFVVKYTDVFKE